MNNYIGEVVKIQPPTKITKEALASYIAECASVVRDKEPANAMKLLDRLMTESYGGKASRVLEYIPCRLQFEDLESIGDSTNQIFGFYAQKEYYTNARELLNWGWSFDEVLEAIDFTNYIAVKCEAPYFIYGQLSTHTQITSVSHSQRYGVCDRGYWMPKEFIDYAVTYLDKQELWNTIVENTSPIRFKQFMKEELKIVRKEVWDRGADMLQNRVFTLGGYTNNPNAWEHFINQRLDSHTQQETREFTSLIKEVVWTQKQEL